MMHIYSHTKTSGTRIFAIMSACLIGLSCYNVGPALGAELASKACQLYKDGQFQSAKEAYIDLVCSHPDQYRWRYFLANTYFRLHDYEAALIQYEICMELYPDAQTNALCKMGIKNVKRCLGLPQDISNQFGGTEFLSSMACLRNEREQAMQQSLNSQRDKIITDAHRHAEEIRRAARNRLENIRNNATWWYNDPIKNGLVPVVSSSLEQSIKNDAEAQAEEVISGAQKKADELHLPPSDDVIEGLLSQTQAGTKYSTVRLLPFGSNIYVRNYGHRNNFAVSGLSSKGRDN